MSPTTEAEAVERKEIYIYRCTYIYIYIYIDVSLYIYIIQMSGREIK